MFSVPLRWWDALVIYVHSCSTARTSEYHHSLAIAFSSVCPVMPQPPPALGAESLNTAAPRATEYFNLSVASLDLRCLSEILVRPDALLGVEEVAWSQGYCLPASGATKVCHGCAVFPRVVSVSPHSRLAFQACYAQDFPAFSAYLDCKPLFVLPSYQLLSLAVFWVVALAHI